MLRLCYLLSISLISRVGALLCVTLCAVQKLVAIVEPLPKWISKSKSIILARFIGILVPFFIIISTIFLSFLRT